MDIRENNPEKYVFGNLTNRVTLDIIEMRNLSKW